MEGYIGEIIVQQEDTPFKDYSEKDWALYFLAVNLKMKKPDHSTVNTLY